MKQKQMVDLVDPVTFCDLLFSNSDNFNKGFSVTDLVVAGWFEEEDDMPTEALNAVMQTEGRLFTFFGKLKHTHILGTKQGQDQFLYHVLAMETEIIDFFRSHKPGVDFKSIVDAEDFNPVNKDIIYEAGDRYVKFTLPTGDYDFIVKVYHDTGYREGFIDDTYVFTKAGGLEIADLYTLFKVHEDKKRVSDEAYVEHLKKLSATPMLPTDPKAFKAVNDILENVISSLEGIKDNVDPNVSKDEIINVLDLAKGYIESSSKTLK